MITLIIRGGPRSAVAAAGSRGIPLMDIRPIRRRPGKNCIDATEASVPSGFASEVARWAGEAATRGVGGLIAYADA